MGPAPLQRLRLLEEGPLPQLSQEGTERGCRGGTVPRRERIFSLSGLFDWIQVLAEDDRRFGVVRDWKRKKPFVLNDKPCTLCLLCTAWASSSAEPTDGCLR